MFPPQFLSLIEMLVFNSIICDRCCHRKYSLGKTIGILGSVFVFLLALVLLFRPVFSVGDGRLAFLGFAFLIPLRYLYKENGLLLFTIMCTCWLYTFGIFALSQQIAGVLSANPVLLTVCINSMLLLASAYPFFKWFVPMYIFIFRNIPSFDTYRYKYLSLNICFNFVLLLILHNVFIREEESILKILTLILLVTANYLYYFILYRIVQDTLKMDRLEYAAFHDPLTGLGNRSMLWEHLKQLLKENQTFSLLFIDLDRFKEINDKYGHLTGDWYLKHYAEICSGLVRGKGQAYRFGGDEFLIIYQDTAPEALLNQLRTCPKWGDDAPCPFNQASAGMLLCRPPHQSADRILQQVDRFMYQNKQQKANKISPS